MKRISSLVFFSREKFNYEYFKIVVDHLLLSVNNEQEDLNNKIFYYLNFYYHSYEHIFSNVRYVVYLLDCNGNLFGRVSMSDPYQKKMVLITII